MNDYIPPFDRFGSCYRCAERHPRCHGECLRYAKWKKYMDEIRPAAVPMTEAHEKKIRNALRRDVKNRADGRKNHTGD